jgi:hypothetical protein
MSLYSITKQGSDTILSFVTGTSLCTFLYADIHRTFEYYCKLYCLGVEVRGIAACSVSAINGIHYITGASYHNNGWKTKSKVFRFDSENESLKLHQEIEATGCYLFVVL